MISIHVEGVVLWSLVLALASSSNCEVARLLKTWGTREAGNRATKTKRTGAVRGWQV
ncbi:hypothetical protein K493DRAFT_7753 [Basidiobolus meristosporus CBS 931.73]|uniref:Uncharacterized protein n=1 Tax=Basidiobolus meristosporus CBS 931.73 TaxID=1314790 RepID=A0A1Y1YL91_9FUNG|nr:hypothetical protein K493DRAFT_7753 [Basidiobolus meristosporus CBS 931.73]|eukprot:ORX98354.1 hypothetical protein K493DRAFT_7753 [Basidiobolus meristosporus CBS 931.73]